MNRNQKRKLERQLAKQPKDTRKLVDVIRLEDTEKGQVPIFGFMTYGWTFPLLFEHQGKIKSGISNNPFDNGSIRMKQACSNKTSNGEQPYVINDLKQVWEIPMDFVGLDKSKANKLRNKFDERCNKALSKYKVKDETTPLIGEEWYREISIEEIKALRTKIWEELLIELGTKAIKKVHKKIEERGLQIPAVEAIIKEFKEGTSRFKGIAPTGFGKTVVAFLTIAKLKAQGLLKNRVVMMTAPNQFLANKNAAAFDEYAIGNKVKNIINIPVFSGSDLGFTEEHIAVLERKDKLAAIIQARLNDNPNATIVLHTCNPSVELVDEVLDMISINEIDFAICDEAHTLASTFDSRWNFVLQDDKVKIKSRFFLTATEKTLSNPDFLEHVPNRGDRVAKFNYMNNKEIFGDYCFKFSFAQGVDEGHIVPMIAKVFEYSNGNTEVAGLLEFIDALDIPELKNVTDENGIAYDYFDKKLARSIISIISAFNEEGRNKSLTICSRNSHVDLLIKVAKAIQNSGKYLQDIELTSIKAKDYSPSERQDLLDDIHDSDKKQIVITGPWAITGVDCPSLDHIHWNFTPGTEISITQGTGRGARLYDGKQNVLVTFNLDLDNPIFVIQSKVSSTILKLHEAMFPSHDIELRERVRRKAGRRFLRVKKDSTGIIEPSIRISLDRIYKATEGYDLLNIINSSFIHHRNKDQWAIDFILEHKDTILKWTEDPNRTFNITKELSNQFFRMNKVLMVNATFFNKLRYLYEVGKFPYPITTDHKYDYFKKMLSKDISTGKLGFVLDKFIDLKKLNAYVSKYDSKMIYRSEKPIIACYNGYGFSKKMVKKFAEEYGYTLLKSNKFKEKVYETFLKKMIHKINIDEVANANFLINTDLFSFIIDNYSNLEANFVKSDYGIINRIFNKKDRHKMGELLYYSNNYDDLTSEQRISLTKSCAGNGFTYKKTCKIVA